MLENLIYRWESAYTHGRGQQLYCLAGIHLLSFVLQASCIKAIKRSIGNAKCPLLIISGSSEKQQITSAFADFLRTIIPLPRSVLFNVVRETMAKYCTVSLFSSRFAGAGKSFQVRCMSQGLLPNALDTGSCGTCEEGAAAATTTASSSLTYGGHDGSTLSAANICSKAMIPSRYIHVPVFRAKELQSKVAKNLAEHTCGWSDAILVHIDLSDSASSELDSILFELAFFFSLIDPITGLALVLSPSRTIIAIEVPCGSFKQRVPLCEFFSQQIIVAQSTSFVASPQALRAGMGTAFNNRPVECMGEWPDAYIRLQYVCSALRTLESCFGSFPFEFDTFSGKPLSGAECFRLINLHSQQGRHVSLWCLWSFVNIMYYQLREMHHPESPLNCACMLDPSASSTRDREIKEKIKGELILFLCKTASEFSTRQAVPKTRPRVVELVVNGFSRSAFNGVWYVVRKL